MDRKRKPDWNRMEIKKKNTWKKRDQISNYRLLVYTSKEKPNSNKLHSFNSSVFFLLLLFISFFYKCLVFFLFFCRKCLLFFFKMFLWKWWKRNRKVSIWKKIIKKNSKTSVNNKISVVCVWEIKKNMNRNKRKNCILFSYQIKQIKFPPFKWVY